MNQERELGLAGAENVRDLGGYRTGDGAVTTWRRLFRAAGLEGLTAADHVALTSVGVTTVFDLRGEREASENPDRLPSEMTYVHAPMSQAEAETGSMLERIANGEYSEFSNDMMANGYLSMMQTYGEQIGDVVRAAATGEPLIFHCAAGKDRTGVVAMVLLGLVGVDHQTIVEDYHLTERHRPRGAARFDETMQSYGIDPVKFQALGTAPREVMERTLAGLVSRWGSIERYGETIGIDAEIRSQLSDAFTTRS